jgi:mRNA interferase MazF
MSPAVRRGEVYRVRHPQHGDPKKPPLFRRCKPSGVARLQCKSSPVCAGEYVERGLATEIGVGVEEGLKHPSVVNCDQLTRLEKSVLTDYIGMLSSKKLGELRTALR